ncbi:MAG: hypothetical protein HQL56_07545 [Magnetococcales bacterium]|nr:hypothetical protein [Magnetococcales bacterium]
MRDDRFTPLRRLAWASPLLFGLMAFGTASDEDLFSAEHPEEHDLARELVTRGQIRALSAILQENPSLAEGRILEVHLKKRHNRYIYEVSHLDGSGRFGEWEFDAVTGVLLERKREH